MSGRLHGRGARANTTVAALLGLGLVALAGVVHAAAAPVEGMGTADVDPEAGVPAARKKALARARQSALEAALASVPSPVDAAAKKAVQKSAEAWTGAYRILEQRQDGSKVTVRVEVDIDAVRLTKRIAKKKAKSDAPRFALHEVVASDACGSVDQAWVGDELRGLGVVHDEASQSLSLTVACRELGPVRYTHMHAASVRVRAGVPEGVLADEAVHGFGADGPEAIRAAVHAALEDVALSLRAREAGQLRVRVESPLPSARVRRFEQLLRNSVLGVDEVEVVGIEPGVVALGVTGDVSLRVLAQRLEALSPPGFSLTITGVSEPDVLTVRFH